ncbi:MAG: alpha/beta hydrolase [Pseudomonadota bacterium]
MPQIKANGISFEYDEIGPSDGDPVLLVMGFGAQMTFWPDSFRQPLADAGYRVIRFDNRDIGLSHQFDDKGIPNIAGVMAKATAGEDASDLVPYKLDDMVADTAAVIEALDIKPAHIVGASMGGMIAQLLTLDYPGHVRSLTAMMTTSGDPSLPPAKPEAMAALTAQPESPARDDVIATGVTARKTIGSHPDVRDPDDMIRDKVATGFDRAYRPFGVMRQYGAILAQTHWYERLGDIAKPTLVVHGVEDPLLPVTSGRDVANRIEGAEIAEVEKWGHDLPEAVTPELARIVSQFLERMKISATS